MLAKENKIKYVRINHWLLKLYITNDTKTKRFSNDDVIRERDKIMKNQQQLLSTLKSYRNSKTNRIILLKNVQHYYQTTVNWLNASNPLYFLYNGESLVMSQ